MQSVTPGVNILLLTCIVPWTGENWQPAGSSQFESDCWGCNASICPGHSLGWGRGSHCHACHHHSSCKGWRNYLPGREAYSPLVSGVTWGKNIDWPCLVHYPPHKIVPDSSGLADIVLHHVLPLKPAHVVHHLAVKVCVVQSFTGFRFRSKRNTIYYILTKYLYF